MAQSLARTYSDRVYPDPWEKVKDYRRVQEYAARNPDAGRTRVGNTLELPPSRVRGWLNDTIPDPVRGVDTAIDHGWLDPGPESATATGLVQLAAHVIAGGSINDNWVPAVAVGQHAPADWIESAFDAVGVKTTQRNGASESRATEIVASDGGTVLGRCLNCLGVPRGSKSELSSLPSVLDDVPDSVRREYARITVRHRGVRYEEKATTRINIHRGREYGEKLAELLRAVTGETVTVGERGVTVSANAMRELGVAD